MAADGRVDIGLSRYYDRRQLLAAIETIGYLGLPDSRLGPALGLVRATMFTAGGGDRWVCTLGLWYAALL